MVKACHWVDLKNVTQTQQFSLYVVLEELEYEMITSVANKNTGLHTSTHTHDPLDKLHNI